MASAILKQESVITGCRWYVSPVKTASAGSLIRAMAVPNLSFDSLFFINIASIPSKRGKYSRPRASNHAESSSMSTGRVKFVNSSSILIKAVGLGTLRSSVPAVC